MLDLSTYSPAELSDLMTRIVSVMPKPATRGSPAFWAAARIVRNSIMHGVAIEVGRKRSTLATATRLFDMLGAVFPKRYTAEELGDALEKISQLEAAGASRWVCRAVLFKTVFWLIVNMLREVVPVLTGLAKFAAWVVKLFS